MFQELMKENIYYKMVYFLLVLLPISMVTSSVLMNLIVIMISLIFLLILIKEKNYEIFKNKFFILIFIFFIFLILNLVNSIDVSKSLNRTFGFLRFILLAFAISHFLSYEKFKYFKIVSIFWIFIFMIVSIDLLFEFIFGHNIVGYSNQFPGRLSSFLNDELKIGGFYFGFVMFSIASIFSFYKYKIGVFFTLFFLIIITLIGERANLIKVISSVILFFSFINFFNIKQKILLLIFLITVSFLTVFNNENIKNRFADQFISYIYSNGIYTYYHISNYGAHYNSAIGIINNNMLFGVGLKNFPIECAKDEYINKKFTFHQSRCSTHPHQIHLDIITSVGFIGYILLMASLMYLLFKNIRLFKKNNNIFTLAGISFLISSLIIPVPSGSFFSSYGATIFWVNIGIILAFEKYKVNK